MIWYLLINVINNNNELIRLQRLCKHQAEQLDSQDQTIRQLKKQLQQIQG